VEAVEVVGNTPAWAWASLAVALILSCAALALALYTARSTAALGSGAHETRCAKRHEEVADDFRKLRREYAALADDVTADVETAALERSRAQAARARTAKAEKNQGTEPGAREVAAGPESRAEFARRMRLQRYGGAA
jgi:cell division protein FtsL